MTKDIFFIVLTALLYWGYGVFILRYLIKYRIAVSNWNEFSAVVVSNKVYPRSYGIVPTVEYSIRDEQITSEVVPCYFLSGFSESDQVTIYVDPKNNLSCFLESKQLFIKNSILLFFITVVCVSAEFVFISKLMGIHF